MPVDQTLNGLALGLIGLMALAATVLVEPVIRSARNHFRRSR